MTRPAEATSDQRAAFAHALSSHLPDRGDAVALASKLGVNKQAVYNWADGKREPQRAQVFALESALGIPGGALSHLLGYLPVGAAPSVTVALAALDLNAEQRAAVLRIVDGYLRESGSNGATR